jgi:glycosyltransferase involved in cell wall biosynthesis
MSISPAAVIPAVPLKVTVAALTFRRPDGLRTLLEALCHQEQTEARPYELTVVIVDNDATGSGRPIAEMFADSEAYRLIYAVEARQGIPMARNRAMDEAPTDTGLFVFIDDDEWPVPGWLDAMLATRSMTCADVIHGPVEPIFALEGNQYFIRARAFADRHHLDGERIDYAASNNVMMDFRRVQAAGLRFDERMRFTGGEDYFFFNQAVRRGFTISWSQAAMVFDGIPASRMTWKWVLQRQFRIGNTFAVAARIQDGRGRQLRLLGVGVLRMGLGTALLPTLAFSPRYGFWGLAHLIRGTGIVVGMFGLVYEEYSPAKLARPGFVYKGQPQQRSGEGDKAEI